MKNMDTRVRYTRSALRSALLELLKEKSIDKITIKEICDRAKLNRGTFYLHYDSPTALLIDIENTIMEENSELFFSFWTKGREQSIMVSLFSCIKENRDSLCILMGPNGDPHFIERISNAARSEVLNQWQLEFPHYSREDLDFIFDFVFIGSMRLILNWLQDSKGIPASQFAKRIERLGHYALTAIREF